MFFRSVKLENFMSYGSQAFDGLDAPGLTLIEGRNLDEGDSNGAGKSSLFDAISWALFGSTVRGVEGDEVVNRKEKKNCHVKVVFDCNKKKYEVHRFRKCDKNGNRLFYDVDGVVVEKGTVKLTQEALTRELGIDFDLFRCTVIFAQGEMFSFVDATNKEQKEILSKIMRINFDELLAKAKSGCSEGSEKVMEVERKVEVLNSHVIEDVDAVYAEDVAKWQSGKEGREKDMMSEIQKFQEYLKELGEPKEISPDLKTRLEKEIEDARKQLTETVRMRGVLGSKVDGWNRERFNISELLKAGKCPKCKRGGITEFTFVDEEAELNTNIERAKSASLKLGDKEKSIEDKLEKLSRKESELVDKINEQKTLKREIEISVKNIEECTKRLVTERKAENPFAGKIEEEKKRQEQIRENLKKLDTEIEGLRAGLPYWEFWKGAFGDGGIKSFIFDLICSSLTIQTNKYANILTSGSVMVTFDSQSKLKSGEFREKFEAAVLKDGVKVPYCSYSGGEKRRVSLAVDMALSDIMADYYGSTFNMVVFDEQTGFLDKSGRVAFMELLKELGKTKRVFVIDHDAEFKGMFGGVWTIEKKDGVSRLV